MRNSKKIAKSVLAGALVLAVGAATVFAGAGESYAASDVKLSKTSRNILTRRSYDFDVVGASANAVVTWKSNDESIATVDANGVVTGVTKGETKITCEVKDGGKTTTLTATVRIRKPAVKIVIKNKISELKYGEKYDLNRTLTPSTSNDVTTWKSSDKSVATVDKNGVVTAKKNGTVTITATTMSGKTDSVKIKVYGAPEATKAPTAVPTKAPAAQPTKAPAATKAPTAAPTKAPAVTSATKYDVTKLEQGGYGYSQSGNKVTLDALYQEVQYTLPKALTAGDYKSLTVTLANATDAVAVKLYNEAGDMLAVWYNVTETSTFAMTESHGLTGGGAAIDQTAKVAKVAIMANNGACSLDVKTIEFVANASAAKPTEAPKATATPAPTKASEASGASYDVTKLEQAGWGYSQKGTKATLDGLYQEVQYTLPKVITAGDYKNMTVTLANATDAVAVKLYDEAGTMLAVWYNVTETTTFSMAEHHGQSGQGGTIDPSAKVAKVAIMANNGPCSVDVKGISFK